MMRKIYLEGELGAKFGEVYPVKADTFADALRCLDCNLEGFREYFISAADKDINFVADIAGAPVQDERELLMIHREGDFVLTPLPAGSKSGGAKILAAIAITALTAGAGALVLSGGNVAAAGSVLATKGGFAYSLGTAAGYTAGQVAIGLAVNLALTGVQQIMAPDPSVDNDQEESYIFQGSGQTAVEGDPVPILYGKLRVPGRPISFEASNSNIIRNTGPAYNGAGNNPGQGGNGQGGNGQFGGSTDDDAELQQDA